MSTFFTSDTHFGHSDIIQFSNRPFFDVSDMNAALIDHWNKRVSTSDVVYHLGDFAMGRFGHKFFSELNGYKVLVRGNHDQSVTRMLDMGWNEVHNGLKIELDGFRLQMTHKPPQNPKQALKVDYWLCGHVHQAWKRKGNVINVGVDVRNYQPVILQELIDGD